MKIAIFASTSGSDLPAIFELQNKNIEFVLLTNKPKCGAIEKAKQYGVPIIAIDGSQKTREEFDEAAINILEAEKADYVILIGYMRIITDAFIHAWKGKMYNIHPSLLPAFAGAMDQNVHQAVLERGCKITGATLHEVTEVVDGGPIVDQKACPVESSDTPETLKQKVQQLEQQMLVALIENLSTKNAQLY